MSFRNTCFKEELSVAAFVVREIDLALTIRIGMCVFLCLNESEISFFYYYYSKGSLTLPVIKYTTIIQTS